MLRISGDRYAGITSSSNVHNHICPRSLSLIAPLYVGDTIHVENVHLVTSTAGYHQTSVTIFSISSCMEDQTEMFSVARTDSVTGAISPFPFNLIVYDDDISYDEFSHTFWAWSAGVYYFSFSVGLNPSSRANFTLYKNDEPYVDIVRLSTIQSGTDTMARSIMMNLEEFDTIHIVNTAGLTARSSDLKETSFSGFKYDPKVDAVMLHLSLSKY